MLQKLLLIDGRYIALLMFVPMGLFFLLPAIFNWKILSYMKGFHSNVKTFGLPAVRIFYALLGLISISFGIFLCFSKG